MTFRFAVPVLGALALMSALPEAAEARGRGSFDISVGVGYSNYNGYSYGNYNTAFGYSSGPRYYGGHSHYYAPPVRYYAPAPVYRSSYYCPPAPCYNYYNNYGYSYPSYYSGHRGSYYGRGYYCD